MNRYAQLLCEHRLGFALAVVVATLAAAMGIARVEYDEDPRSIFANRGPDYEGLEQLFRDFGPDDNDVLVVIESPELFTADVLQRARTLVFQLQEIDGVASVDSIFSVRKRGSRLVPLIPSLDGDLHRLTAARDQALRHPVVAGHLLSEDGRTMIVMVRLEGESISVGELEPRVARARQVVDRFAGGANVQVRLTGHPVIRVDVLQAVRADFAKFLIISGIVSAILGVILFRHLVPVAIAMAGPAVGVVFIIGGMGWVGERVNTLNSVLPTVVFVIGFTDSVHLLLEMHRRRLAGVTQPAAVRAAIRKVGPACGLTSLTTCLGFGSLMVAEVQSVQRFGAAAACGTLLCFLAVIAVMPLLASTRLAGQWGRVRALTSPYSTASSQERHERAMGIARIVPAYMRLFRWPRLITAAAIFLTLGLAAAAIQVRSDIRWMEMLPTDSETARATRRTDEAFGGALLAYVVVEWPADRNPARDDVVQVLAEVHRVIEADETLRGPFSVLNLLLSISSDARVGSREWRWLGRVPTRIVERLLRTDRRQAVVTAHVPDVGAAELIPTFAGLEEELAAIESRYSGYRLHLTGTSVVAARNVHHMISDLGRSLAVATVIVFLVMMINFRSLRLGLISIVPNCFPLALAGACLVLSGETLRLTSAITFSICLGIAVDDTIHFLSKFRAQRLDGAGPREAIEHSLSTAGKAMLITSAILVGGFASLLFSQMPPVRLFGGMASLAILAALVGDLVILPSLLLTFDSHKS